MKTAVNKASVASLSNIVFAVVKLPMYIGLLASATAFGQTTLTWTGADANDPTELGDATNWSGNVLPSPGAGDLGQWNGSVAGNLSLGYTSGLAGSAGNLGINLLLTAAQTGNLSIDSTSLTGLRVNNITNNSAAAALTLGSQSGSYSFEVLLGGSAGQTSTWINNSSATATINNDVGISLGGGGTHPLILGGTGNWAWNGYLGSYNASLFNISMNSPGVLTLNDTGAPFPSGPAGTTTINAGTVRVLGGQDTFQGGSTPAGYNIDGFQYGSLTVNTNGLFDLNGISVTIDGLNGSLGTIDTMAGGTPTLTIGANGDGGTFSGVIQNSSGSLAVVYDGTNTLTLTGTNTYTGGTTVNAGTLMVDGQISGNVTVTSGSSFSQTVSGSFGGTGTVPGNVNWESGSTLTLVPNQPLNLTGNATLNNNTVVVYVPGAIQLPGGTYTLMTYNPANVTGSLNNTPVFSGAGAASGTYSISMSAGTVTLTVVSSAAVGTWTNGVNGNWSIATNWSSNPLVPHSPKDTATLGVGTNFTTVTLDAPETVGILNFTNANSFAIANAGNTLTLDNSGSGATVTVTGGGSNVIAAPVFLNDNATITITPNAGNVLSFSNVISGASGKTLTLANGGTLGLYAANTYGPAAGTVGTTLTAGTLVLGNANALGLGDLSAVGGTLSFSAPLTLDNNIQIPATKTLTLNDGGNVVSLNGAISGGGSITCSGTSTVTLMNVGAAMNTVSAHAGHLVLASSGTEYTNLESISNSVIEVSSGSITEYNNIGTINAFADNGGTFTIDSGATITAIGTTAIGVANTAGSPAATLNVNGTIIDNAATFLVGRNGTGVLNLNPGGLIVVANAGKTFELMQNTAFATFNLNGGTLVTGAIGNSAPTSGYTNAVFNFNGGTLKATNTTASAFWNNYSSFMRVYVRNGGGILDNNGITITNKQPFLHTTNTADNVIDGGMTYKGIGTTVLSGVSNSFNGPVTIAAGTVILTNSEFNSASTVSISSGAVLQLNNLATNAVAGLVLGGVAQPNGIYNNANAPTYITGLGALQVGPAGPIAPTNSPTITQFSLSNVGPSGGNVVINGTNGDIGATYYLLTSTNLTTPLPQWEVVSTNIATTTAFSFTGTNAMTAGAKQQFYILSSTNY